ncbi:MAG: glycoside hydrolase family 9 protein [Prevotella sp.]|nr:glycoside hydrolase family 9 protein [Prevotella sp.]
MRRTCMVALLALLLGADAMATKLIELKVVDQDYLVVHLRDGEVHYRDNGTGPSAYLGHSFAEGDDTLLVFGQRLNTALAQQATAWTVSSADDRSFGRQQPVAVWRKSKPMNTDHTLSSELDHWLYLQLPQSMRQGSTYTVSLPAGLGADRTEASVCFDVWNAQSEAIHVSLTGYLPMQRTHAADLYQWLGDGGSRDYNAWQGRGVYLYNVDTKKKQRVGSVTFWKHATEADKEAGKKNLVGTDVWNIDFKSARPGRYRLVVEGVGCSMDFTMGPDVYREPFRYSVRGYYYMRLGEPIDTPRVWPIPRQPQFTAETDPKGFTIYKTDLHPWHPDWRKLRGDVWDEPHFKPVKASAFWQHRLPGNPVALDVRGGHSDAMDWDRHLAHVSNIYDMLLPYILCGGKVLGDDDLGIRESGNGLPDLLDEARNEVDFFLSIRDGEAYSQGVTNPSADWTVMFQAGCTTMAAWANAANCAMMGEAFRLAGVDSLRQYYTDEAVRAFRFASRQADQQLDDHQGIGTISMRGRDFRQLAAAFLYNLTGDTEWEDIMAQESRIDTDHSPLFQKGRDGYCQLWAAAAYLTCPHPRHQTDLYQHLLASVNAQAESYHLQPQMQRPSRRAASDDRWHTAEDVDQLLMAHYAATTEARRQQLLQAMLTEASWSLGRNPGNIVEMTGLGPRHITDVYSTGRNDGAPGTHPGQTPFNGTETWSPGDGGDARILLDRCYPSWNDGGWPRQESYFNQRYMWVNAEFTPRETMRGKMALLAYLYAVGK